MSLCETVTVDVGVKRHLSLGVLYPGSCQLSTGGAAALHPFGMNRSCLHFEFLQSHMYGCALNAPFQRKAVTHNHTHYCGCEGHSAQ